MQKFSGKTIIVTGGASGIGEATVRQLYDQGANIVIFDRERETIEARFADLADTKRLLACACDVSSRDDVAAAFAACVSAFGVPDGLVNCAGIRGVGSILDTEFEVFQRNFEVNLLGGFLTCQAFARLVVDAGRPGAIVNVSSAAGLEAVPNRLAYVASKHGMVGLTRAAAFDLATLGVRVNGVAPGTIRTPMLAKLFEDPDSVARVRASHPIGREGEAGEVAAAILFLLSDEASFMTGAIVPVDGGSTAGQQVGGPR